MSDSITLTLRAPLAAAIALDGVQPHRCADLSERDIADIPVWIGRTRAHLGDFFSVRGERSTSVRIEGSTSAVNGLGAGMAGGELIVEGDAGDDAGTAMSGGLLRIDGSAGARLGSALPGAAKGMSGGEIIVGGSAGAEAGARLRRGLIVVAGDLGVQAGRSMIAGSIVVLGSCGEQAGLGSKRGSLVACGGIAVPATYRYACTFSPPSVRLTLTYLKRRHGLTIDNRLIDGDYRRYCGDAADPGKGEILELCMP